MRNYGSKKRYHNEVVEVNSQLDELQAAFLPVKLGVLDDWNARRRALAERYFAGLHGGRELLAGLDSVWHLLVVWPPQRDELQARLAAEGIATLVHHPVLPHQSQAYAAVAARFGARGSLNGGSEGAQSSIRASPQGCASRVRD